MGGRQVYFAGVPGQIISQLVRNGPYDLVEVSVSTAGIDPEISLGQLGEQLTGVSMWEIGKTVEAWSRPIEVPADPADRETLFAELGFPGKSSAKQLQRLLRQTQWSTYVVQLTDQLRDALAAVAPTDCQQVAARWNTTEELRSTPVDELLPIVQELGSLARTARNQDQRLYCWIML
jgi:hypothetical protein